MKMLCSWMLGVMRVSKKKRTTKLSPKKQEWLALSDIQKKARMDAILLSRGKRKGIPVSSPSYEQIKAMQNEQIEVSKRISKDALESDDLYFV